MNTNRRDPSIVAIWVFVLVLLIIAFYVLQLRKTSPAPESAMLLSTSVETNPQATLAAALTQEKSYADNQAAATAEIMRANAQATLNSADATLSAAQTQQQNSADVIAAQMAAAAEIVRADAQATLNAANSTQSAALTQDAESGRRQVQEQQNKDEIAAGTQTAVANLYRYTNSIWRLRHRNGIPPSPACARNKDRVRLHSCGRGACRFSLYCSRVCAFGVSGAG